MDHAHEETQNPFGVEPIGRLILKFAIPSVIALLVNSLYNIVDQIFIGWGVGYLGNGATNIVFPITIVALALAMMIGNGGAAFLSLKLGEGELEDARKGVGNAVTLVTVVSVVLTLVFLIWINPILNLFGATDILRPYALEYGTIIGIGLPFMMISAAINSMIRADGMGLCDRRDRKWADGGLFRQVPGKQKKPGKPIISGFPGIDTKTALRFGRLFLY